MLYVKLLIYAFADGKIAGVTPRPAVCLNFDEVSEE